MKTNLREMVSGMGLALKPLPEHVSVSQITAYNQCQLQWFLKYGTTAIPHYPDRMLIGTLVHKALETANNLRYHGQDVDAVSHDTVMNVVETSISAVDESAYVWSNPAKDVFNRTRRVASKAIRVIPELPRALLIESPISGLDLGGIPLEGYIDMYDEAGYVRDFKIVSRHKSQADCDNDIQLSLYAWAMGTPYVSFVSINSSTGEYKIIESVRDTATIGRHVGAMTATAQSIANKCFCEDPDISDFPPNLGSIYGCSGCAFYHLCPYGGGANDNTM